MRDGIVAGRRGKELAGETGTYRGAEEDEGAAAAAEADMVSSRPSLLLRLGRRLAGWCGASSRVGEGECAGTAGWLLLLT
jgi:hypothetical protein